MLRSILEDGNSVIVRSSGMKPKLKVYISIVEENKNETTVTEASIKEDIG